ncbi:hydroxyacylglutathione hydrolase [Natronospira proteinivora]|uniref:Hydroxyacylglutathione hydrolase n=1 Tax=Natronospira proteinivora TaxID=1807133 RepID=A0ABT1G803_9GAMM|nr:hydroxyacylglutathione hydrolase [Natronospira proteinivora]MCP1727075.1 hydroxyacylglutathione hydrolase [Natronospira proteinivora]
MHKVTPVSALSDNYVWLIHGEDPSRVAIVDPGEAAPVQAKLCEHGLTPEAILITHRHWDHVNGIEDLLAVYDIPVYGPAEEPVPCRSQGLRDGDTVSLDHLGLTFRVLGIPGHTLGHIAYHGHGLLLSGDTLFAGGCGRMFEGEAAQMLASLDKLAGLPDKTYLYCGHEYTLKNLAFCEAVEPDNPWLHKLRQRAEQRLAANQPTLPTMLGEEKQYNVFLRCREAAIQASASRKAGQELHRPDGVFATLRQWKDQF